MKLIHISDTHLGYSSFNKLDQKGRNLREIKVYEGFRKAVDKILEVQPDVVVHSGDVFHHVRPRVFPLFVFKEQVHRLHDAGIQLVIISGNHDAPKSTTALSPFYLFEGMPGVHIAHKDNYEKFDICGVRFHCIPFLHDPSQYEKKVESVEYTGSDVLVVHGLCESLKDRRLKTVGEHELSNAMLKENFSYIALGHFHGQMQMAGNAWYSGSIEYLNFGEAGDKKGMLQVNPDTGTASRIEVDTLKMIDCWVDCESLTADEITERLENEMEKSDINNRLVRVNLSRIDKNVYKHLNSKKLRDIEKPAFHMYVKPYFKEENDVRTGTEVDLGDLGREFGSFISHESMPENIRDEVVKYSTSLLEKALAEHRMEALDVPE